jgi:glyoxylase-like metal-dependent hydrolase (beta-lactamase superfamily II)
MTRLPTVKRFVSNTDIRIYRIPCDVLPDLSGRVYLIAGAGPATLVDTGSGRGDSTRQVLEGIHTVRRDFGESIAAGDIHRILITHGHIDHFGGLAELAAKTNAQVAAHCLDAHLISAFEERALVRRKLLEAFLHQAGVAPRRQEELLAACGYVSHQRESVPVDLLLEDGAELDGLKFVHTPGHSPGHVCIAVGDVLLAGDHILARTVPQQWPESTAAYTGLGHYLESLEKVRRMGGFRVTLGGHEPPVRDLPARIDEIRLTHTRRLERLVDIVRRAPGPLTMDEMTTKMYSHQQGFFYMLALSDVGARVEYLYDRGHLAVANLDEVRRQKHPVYRYVAM